MNCFNILQLSFVQISKREIKLFKTQNYLHGPISVGIDFTDLVSYLVSDGEDFVN